MSLLFSLAWIGIVLGLLLCLCGMTLAVTSRNHPPGHPSDSWAISMLYIGIGLLIVCSVGAAGTWLFGEL